MEVEFQPRNDQVLKDRRNIWKEISLKLLSIAAQHLVRRAFFLENTGFDSDLLTVNGNEVPPILFGILFFLRLV
jgi:hypothetical protein